MVAGAECGLAGSHSLWWLGKSLMFIVACFVFSFVFWKVHDWTNCEKPKKNKRK
jgi:hypothetical protein